MDWLSFFAAIFCSLILIFFLIFALLEAFLMEGFLFFVGTFSFLSGFFFFRLIEFFLRRMVFGVGEVFFCKSLSLPIRVFFFSISFLSGEVFLIFFLGVSFSFVVEL